MAAAKGAKQRAQALGCTRWSASLDSLQHLQTSSVASHTFCALLTDCRPVSFILARCSAASTTAAEEASPPAHGVALGPGVLGRSRKHKLWVCASTRGANWRLCEQQPF